MNISRPPVFQNILPQKEFYKFSLARQCAVFPGGSGQSGEGSEQTAFLLLDSVCCFKDFWGSVPEPPWDIIVLQFRSAYQETESLKGQVRGEGVCIKTRPALGVLHTRAASGTGLQNPNIRAFQNHSFHYFLLLLPRRWWWCSVITKAGPL